MTWREAFLVQARSDHALFERLAALRAEACHRLHYFQMVTEKLAKAWLTGPEAGRPPKPVHAAFVRMLQVIKSQPAVRRQLGYERADVFKKYVDSLLELARRIEALAPAIAGFSQPNAEHPWQDAGTGSVQVPATYPFTEFDRKTNLQMAKLDRLVRALLRAAR